MRVQLFTLLTLLCCFSSLMQAQTAHPEYIDGRLFVKLKNDVTIRLPDYNKETAEEEGQTPSSIKDYPVLGALLEEYGVSEISRPFPLLKSKTFVHTYEVVFQDYMRAGDFINQIKQDPLVEYAERIPLYTYQHTPNDADLNDQWYLDAVEAYAAWDINKGDENIVVAVVDDAVKITHEDIAPNLWVNTGEIPNNGKDDDNNGYVDDVHGYDVADNDGDPNPPSNATASGFSHGTHVASIAASAGGNGKGIASLAYGVSIMGVKCTKSNTSNTSVIQYGWPGVQYAIAAGADVINLSWGGTGYSQTYENIVNEAFENGVIMVAAAGNSNTSTPFYPAAYDNVLGVASVSDGDIKSSFSNYGNWVNISAPGSVIHAAIATNNTAYATKSGTSMASPMVASLCALMLSHNPTLTPAVIMQYICDSADPIDSKNPTYAGKLGKGRINALKALNKAIPDGCLTPFQLSTSNLTDKSVRLNWNVTNGSTGYDVQIKKAGGSWQSFSTTNGTYTYNNLDACSDYEFRVRSQCRSANPSNYSPSHSFTSAPSGPQGYCAAAGGTADFEWIAGVKIGGLNNTSVSDGGYASQVCSSSPLNAGQNYTITLTPGYAGAPYPEYWRVWIDFNGNGTFDSNELAYDAGSANTTVVTASISIPSTAKTGATRMRVAMKWVGTGDTGAPTPCMQFEYGELEDYTIEIKNGTGSSGGGTSCNPPTSLSASNIVETSAKVSWNSIGEAGSYMLSYRKSTSSNWTTLSINGTSRTLTGLSSGSTYQYRVKSNCGSTESTYSITKTFTTDAPPCNSPTGLSVSNVSHNSAKVSVINVSGVTGRTFRCREAGTTTWENIESNTTYATIPNLQPSTTYETQAQAECGSANSTFSSTKTFVTDAAPASCPIPANLYTSSVTQSSAILRWSSTSGASSYTVRYRKSGTSNWNTYNVSGTSKSVSNLSAGTTYQFQTRAKCGTAYGNYASIKTFKTSNPTCGNPAGLVASNVSSSSAVLSWNSVASTTGYNVRFRRTGTSSWSYQSATGTSKPISGLTAGKTYEFQVQAKCSFGNSSYSTSKTFTTSGGGSTCSAPSNLGVTNIAATSVQLTWNTVSSAQSYTVRYRKNGTTSWTYKTASSNAYTATNLLACTDYEFAVRSSCGSSSSAYASPYDFTSSCGNNGGDNYCSVLGLNANKEWIDRVKINTINKLSGKDNGYGDYTHISTDLEVSKPYLITLTPGYLGSNYNEYWRIYVDLNQDGDFSDSGEVIFDAGTAQKGAKSGTITIPASAKAGETRLRVTMRYSKAAEACGNYNYGEAEDYTVNIVTASGGGNADPTYCEARSTNASSEWIQKVQFGSINNNSGSNSGYGNYTHLMTSISAGKSYALTLTPGFKSSPYNEYWKVWIDYNRDGVFSANEVAYDANGVSKSTVVTTVAIPVATKTGTTRMRVSMRYNKTAEVCGEYKYGEIEDYTLNVLPPANNTSETYCESESTDAGSEWIDKVVFAGINNASGSDDGYGDYTSKMASVSQGNSYPISLTPGFKSGSYNEYWMVWIDWNRDGTFSSNEVAFNSGGTSKEIVNGIVSVPNTAVSGETRMRIAMRYSKAAGPCESFKYGEVEDYTILVGGGTTAETLEVDCNINIAFEYTVDENTATFENFSHGSYDQFFWSFGDGELSEEENPVHYYEDYGDYFFQVTLTNSELGCSRTFEGYVHILDPANGSDGSADAPDEANPVEDGTGNND